MHWLQQNWFLALGWGLYVLSDAMPFLPSKANGLAQFLLNVGRAVLGGKQPPSPTLTSVPPDASKR